MDNQYVDISPELLGKPDPDQQWIERELDRINPWRHEQGADGADTAALRQLVLELRDKGRSDAQPDNGGPAFPAVIPLVHSEQQGKDYPDYSEAGMTVRDYFAAKAMQACLARGDDTNRPGIAEWAFAMADAMLKARAA